MRRLSRILAAAALSGAAALAVAGDVVVLKGGTVIPLKQPVVRRGSTAYLTRADGTLLSVPVSEIDREATAVANQSAPAAAAPKAASAASTPAEAARTAKDGQKARVRITDADVSHPLDFSAVGSEEKDKKEAAAGEPRVEVADYTREKNGGTLVVKGTLRNPGQGSAENVRLAVAAVDEKGAAIEGGNATLSKGTVDSGATVEFTISLNVGEKDIASLRFTPQWTTPKPPPGPAQAGGRPGAPVQADANRAPAPVPTPFGRGLMYAAPAPSASTEIPSDSHTGYLPSVSSPDNQPKPPSR